MNEYGVWWNDSGQGKTEVLENNTPCTRMSNINPTRFAVALNPDPGSENPETTRLIYWTVISYVLSVQKDLPLFLACRQLLCSGCSKVHFESVSNPLWDCRRKVP